MIWWLLGGHCMGVVLAAGVGRHGIRPSLWVAAVAPAVTAAWAVTTLIARAGSPEAPIHELIWVDGLDLALRFRIDGLALLMVLLVSGIGALVFVNATGYFKPNADGGGRFAATLLAFSASMLGLVLADSIWTLFIFWELTSVTSFLLVGHKNTDAAVQLAARRALMITGGGGLALLAGLILLATEAGTTTLTDLKPVGGTAATTAAVLILVAAATKSAQVPFHVWLPGAMAAPTPVSAYLHSATMVKAGVLLVAVVGPAFAGVAAWEFLGLGFGIASMFWGAVGALRQTDAKLILAWGTISQLGLLITLLSIGSAKATFAALSILVAHGLFKAALFLVVGEIDIRTGTREIAELGGLARSMPLAFATAGLAALSMAGLPPLLGFAAKEAAIEAVLGLEGWRGPVVAGVVILGSVLTVAYTARFLLAVFGPGPPTPVEAPRSSMAYSAAALSALGLMGYVFIRPVNAVVGDAAVELNPAAEVYQLFRWPGLTTAFLVSLAIVLAGSAAGIVLGSRTPGIPPFAQGAALADRMIDGTLTVARIVTVRLQHGSLPVYLLTMASAATLAATPFIVELSVGKLVLWENPLQLLLALAIVAAALAGAVVDSRLGAALSLGAVGVAVSGLFVVAGAPDLVLTQLLVETIVVVGFVIGLGHLKRTFPISAFGWQTTRVLISGLAGTTVALALAAASSAPSGRPPIDAMARAAVDEGGGNNIVNVILTDVRALDTLGEVVVLSVVAIGILALAGAGQSKSHPSSTFSRSVDGNDPTSALESAR